MLPRKTNVRRHCPPDSAQSSLPRSAPSLVQLGVRVRLVPPTSLLATVGPHSSNLDGTRIAPTCRRDVIPLRHCSSMSSSEPFECCRIPNSVHQAILCSRCSSAWVRHPRPRQQNTPHVGD